MIRYLSYVGPKDEKRIDLGIGLSVLFPRGQVVDVTEAGMSEQLAMDLLKSGLFRLRGIADISTSTLTNGLPPQHLCGCGFLAKSKAGLITHQRHCK